MALQSVINYDTAGNFAFDAGKIEVASSVARLILLTGAQSYNEDFTNDTGFTYDSAKAEFSSGQVQQKDQAPADSIMACLFDSKDLNWRTDGGSLTGTLNGSPTISGGVMNCVGSQGLYYSRTTTAIESFYVEYTPNYSGAPVANLNIIGTGSTATNNDRFQLTHSPSGDNWRITLSDSSGVTVISTAAIGASAINLSSGTKYRLVVVLDSAAGTVKLYQRSGGAWALHGTLTPGAWTRGSIAENYSVGATTDIYDRAEGDFDDYVLYDVALDPLTTDPTDTPPSTRYADSNVDLPQFTHANQGTMLSYTSVSSTETSTPRYTIKTGSGSYKYWTGAAWAASDSTYAQANSKADINTNIAALTDGNGETQVTIRAHFTDSNTQSAVDDFTFNYSGQTNYPTDDPDIVQNSGLLMDGLEGFTETTATKPTGSELKYILTIDGVDKYWDGAAWSTSDGTYAQANLATEVNTNSAALTFGIAGNTVKVKALLHSDAGLVRPELGTLTLDYNFAAVSSGLPNKCIIYGEEIFPEQDAVVGMRLKAILAEGFYHTTGMYIAKQVIEVTSTLLGSRGYWEITLTETATDSKTYTFEKVYFRDDGGEVTEQFTGVTVPDQATANFKDII